MNQILKVPKFYLDLLDQVYEIEKKVSGLNEPNTISRNISRMKEVFENMDDEGGLVFHNPLGEVYRDTRTDVDATIAGHSAENLFITEVIKPIIRYKKGGTSMIARKGIVIVESKKK